MEDKVAVSGKYVELSDKSIKNWCRPVKIGTCAVKKIANFRLNFQPVYGKDEV